MPLQNLSQFVYPMLPKSLGMLLVYPKRMAAGVKPKEVFLKRKNRKISSNCTQRQSPYPYILDRNLQKATAVSNVTIKGFAKLTDPCYFF